MWRTTDADYGVTYGGCIADIHSASTYRHADPTAGRYGASSDKNNGSSNTHSNTCCGQRRDCGTPGIGDHADGPQWPYPVPIH